MHAEQTHNSTLLDAYFYLQKNDYSSILLIDFFKYPTNFFLSFFMICCFIACIYQGNTSKKHILNSPTNLLPARKCLSLVHSEIQNTEVESWIYSQA